MDRYKVYFEIYGKKMCKTVEADTERDAQYRVVSDIIFHKTELEEPEDASNILWNSMPEELKSIFNFK